MVNAIQQRRLIRWTESLIAMHKATPSGEDACEAVHSNRSIDCENIECINCPMDANKISELKQTLQVLKKVNITSCDE